MYSQSPKHYVTAVTTTMIEKREVLVTRRSTLAAVLSLTFDILISGSVHVEHLWTLVLIAQAVFLFKHGQANTCTHKLACKTDHYAHTLATASIGNNQNAA